MYTAIKITLIFAVFASIPCMASASASNARIPVANVLEAAKKPMIMNWVIAQNTAPGEITAAWNSTWNGAFNVYLLDLTTNTGVGPFVTNNTTMTFQNLIGGHTYVVSVHDDRTVKASNPVTVHNN